MTDPEPKRRWYQFSLKTLLLFVLLCSLPLSWLGVKLDRARKQRQTVVQISKKCRNGSVHFDYGKGKVWLRKLFGDDFVPAIGVELRGPQVTDAVLEHVKGLRHLQVLSLEDTQVTDAGLVHLKALTSLQVLCLDGARLTDAGLEHLKGLTSLKRLDLDDTQVTDAGVEHLKGLGSLERLDVARTRVTEIGLNDLQNAWIRTPY